MSDSNWCRAVVARVEDDRRGYELTVRDFSRQAGDLQVTWPDRAGRDFQDRYLDPLAAALHDVGDRTSGQLAELTVVVAETGAVEAAEITLAGFSEAVARAVSQAAARSATSARHADAAFNFASASASRSAEADALLSTLS